MIREPSPLRGTQTLDPRLPKDNVTGAIAINRSPTFPMPNREIGIRLAFAAKQEGDRALCLSAFPSRAADERMRVSMPQRGLWNACINQQVSHT